MAPVELGIASEFGRLGHVILGTGQGYHRDPARVEIVNATQGDTLVATGHPPAAQVTTELDGVAAVLRAAGVTVHRPGLAPDSVQDQTCPRDIGFVIGTTFVAAGMSVASRAEEIEGIRHILADCDGRQIAVPPGLALEGGDIVVDGTTVFVGAGQRSAPGGADFLRAEFGEQHEIVPLTCLHGGEQGQDILHLDCTFQPLGRGHALIYPPGLAAIPAPLRRYDWIEVTQGEARALATNVLSIAPDHVIARDAPACARVNTELRRAGYRVTELVFDAVPSTGGSFRCATLPLRRG